MMKNAGILIIVSILAHTNLLGQRSDANDIPELIAISTGRMENLGGQFADGSLEIKCKAILLTRNAPIDSIRNGICYFSKEQILLFDIKQYAVVNSWSIKKRKASLILDVFQYKGQIEPVMINRYQFYFKRRRGGDWMFLRVADIQA
jgi:hypothetical protein